MRRRDSGHVRAEGPARPHPMYPQRLVPCRNPSTASLTADAAPRFLWKLVTTRQSAHGSGPDRDLRQAGRSCLVTRRRPRGDRATTDSALALGRSLPYITVDRPRLLCHTSQPVAVPRTAQRGVRVKAPLSKRHARIEYSDVASSFVVALFIGAFVRPLALVTRHRVSRRAAQRLHMRSEA